MSSAVQDLPLALELLRDRAGSMRRVLPMMQPLRDGLDALRFFVRSCLSLPDDCRETSAAVRHQAFDELFAAKGSGTSLDAVPILERRRLTEQTLDALADVVASALSLVRAPEVGGRLDEFGPRLEKALIEVRTIRLEFSENFPLPNEGETQAARASILRREGIELDDAFAEIAGCSREDWLARVAEYESVTASF